MLERAFYYSKYSMEKIPRPKCKASLWITKIEDINAAFLAKKDWEMFTQPNKNKKYSSSKKNQNRFHGLEDRPRS